jgi:hypothetical protein
MALSKVNFNSLNLTPTASKTVVFNSNNNGIDGWKTTIKTVKDKYPKE